MGAAEDMQTLLFDSFALVTQKPANDDSKQNDGDEETGSASSSASGGQSPDFEQGNTDEEANANISYGEWVDLTHHHHP